jgi:hypothetical protein
LYGSFSYVLGRAEFEVSNFDRTPQMSKPFSRRAGLGIPNVFLGQKDAEAPFLRNFSISGKV